MSFTTTTDMLNDRRWPVPGFFHTLPSRKHTALALVAVLSQFEWRRAVMITGEDNLYTNVRLKYILCGVLRIAVLFHRLQDSSKSLFREEM